MLSSRWVAKRSRSPPIWVRSATPARRARKVRSALLIVTEKDEKGAYVIAAAEDVDRAATAKSVWNRASHDASTYGSALLQDLLPGRSFPFPKSLYAVEDALRFVVKDQPKAVVLDFFCGSGTTAHAVMRLNKQDGGQRRSILVTNNEVSVEESEDLRGQGHLPGDQAWEGQGICEHVAMPRLRASVTGVDHAGTPVKGEYKFVDPFPMARGFEENLEFFELTYEDSSLVSLGRKFQAVAPLLWLMAGATGDRVKSVDEATGWSLPTTAMYGVLFRPSEWSDFVEAVNARADSDTPIAHAFVVTDADSEYRRWCPNSRGDWSRSACTGTTYATL